MYYRIETKCLDCGYVDGTGRHHGYRDEEIDDCYKRYYRKEKVKYGTCGKCGSENNIITNMREKEEDCSCEDGECSCNCY